MRAFAAKHAPSVGTEPARPDRAASGPAHQATAILQLQRTIGNRAVLRLLRAKPGGSSPEDRYEDEADRFADDLLAGRGVRPVLRAPSLGADSGYPVAGDRVQDVQAALAGGSPLPREVRTQFEPALEMDLGGVRVHDGPQAARAADAVSARAFASGSHLVFAEGQYAPGTQEGLRLLAHELAHVAQEGAAPASRIHRANATDPRLPADRAEAIAYASAAAPAIATALTTLGASPDQRSQNVPALVTQEGLIVRPLTPRHDSTVATAAAPNPPINFFPGTANYAGSVVLPPETTHHINAARTQISIRAREHANVDNLLPAAEIEGRIVAAVSEVAHTRAARKTVGALTTFDLYRARFNALYHRPPFSAQSDEFDASMSSRGPKTERSRNVFLAIVAENAAFAAAYDANTGGIKEQVDRYQGPEGLNLLASPGLQRLRNAFFAAPVVPVPAAGYAAFRASIRAVAQTLPAPDRAEVDRSNDWQLLIERHVTSAAQRDEIKDIIRTATPPAPPVVAPPPAAPPPAAPPPAGGVTPQDFVDSVTLAGPAAPVPSIDRSVPVTLTPRSVHPNPNVAIDSQVTVTPAVSVSGANVSPASRWPNAAAAGVPFAPTIAVTGSIALSAQLALVNGPVGLARAAPIAPLPFSIDDRRQTNMGTGWQPAVSFYNGARQATFTAGVSVPRYVGGAQTIGVLGTMPVAPHVNPGLTVSVRSQIERGGAVIAAAQTQAFAPNAAQSPLSTFVIAPPAAMPPGGDVIDIRAQLNDAAGVLVPGSARAQAMTIRAEAAYLQPAAEARWNEDERHFHDAPAAGNFLHHLLGGAGAAPGLANLIDRPGHPGPVVIHPMVQRHDSAAYVTVENSGTPDPTRAAYVARTPPYAAHPDAAHTIVLPRGAGGWRLGGRPALYPGTFILLNRTPDVTLAVPRRPDDELQIYAIHEATHLMDRGTGAAPIERYKTEFRAYWMDGRFGPPELATGPNPGDLDAIFDPALPVDKGPKSARANAIFKLQYDDPILYSYCKPNYDANTNHFREEVDSYLVPDGINLVLSAEIEALRVLFAAGVTPNFATFRTRVRAYFGPGGRLSPNEQASVTRSRAWRDRVDGLAGLSSAQRRTLKADMAIP